MNSVLAMSAAAAALVVAQGVLADGESGDVLILPDTGSGQVRTGAFDDATESILSFHQRVFWGEFGEADPMQPNFAAEPGFRGLPENFANGSSWSFTITGPVSLWNGADFSMPSPYTITLGFGPASVTSPLVGAVSGFSVPVSGTDGFDDHLEVFLDGPTDATSDGVYLLRMSISVPGFADSDEIWLLFNHGIDDAELDDAIVFAQANVPTPGAALAFLAVAGLTAARRRR